MCTYKYWLEDFDENKNCEKIEVMNELFNGPDKDRNCAMKRRGSFQIFINVTQNNSNLSSMA